jgi:hypothetical protein
MIRKWWFVALGWTLIGGVARADELGSGEKSVRLKVRVDAEVPSGRALLLAYTFDGAVRVMPGQDSGFGWHPMSGGDMQLVSVAEADLKDLEELRAGLQRERIADIVDAGMRCGGGFKGIRTLPAASPADSLRWTFRVDFTGIACAARLVGIEYLDGSGNVVDPGPVTLKPITPPMLKAKVDAAAGATPATSGGCDVRGEAAGPAVLVLAALLGRRRRSSGV